MLGAPAAVAAPRPYLLGAAALVMLLAVVLIPRRAASSRARRQCAISQGERPGSTMFHDQRQPTIEAIKLYLAVAP